jgi:hypothetical protein
LASKGFCPPPQDETEAAEREHLGCAYCGTGIYADRATPSPAQAGPEDTDDVWPIVNVTVGEDGQIESAKLYAPGLPPGNHDVYPVRVPYMDEHTEAWLAVAKALQEVMPGYLDGSGNGIECAVKAIRQLATPSPGKAPEPVAWFLSGPNGCTTVYSRDRIEPNIKALAVTSGDDSDDYTATPLYVHPASPGKAPEPVAWLAEHEDDSKDFVNFYEAVARQEAEESGAVRVLPLYASPGKAEAEDAARYRWLRENYLAADFDWQGECVLVFKWPASLSVSADCDATIDAAIQQERDKQ